MRDVAPGSRILPGLFFATFSYLPSGVRPLDHARLLSLISRRPSQPFRSMGAPPRSPLRSEVARQKVPRRVPEVLLSPWTPGGVLIEAPNSRGDFPKAAAARITRTRRRLGERSSRALEIRTTTVRHLRGNTCSAVGTSRHSAPRKHKEAPSAHPELQVQLARSHAVTDKLQRRVDRCRRSIPHFEGFFQNLADAFRISLLKD